MYVYQLVMTEGAEDDLRLYIDVAHLVEMWDDMWLSPHVCERWHRWLRDRDLTPSSLPPVLNSGWCWSGPPLYSRPMSREAARRRSRRLAVAGIIEVTNG